MSEYDSFDNPWGYSPSSSSGSSFDLGGALDSIGRIGEKYLGYKIAKQQIKAQTPEGQVYTEGQPAAAAAQPLFNISPTVLLLAGAGLLVFLLKA